MAKNKKHIAVIAGGYSSEFRISMESAQEVLRSLNPEKYDARVVHITRDGWFIETPDGPAEINKNHFSYQLNGSPVHFDGVFNAIHGHPGENGKLQAYFELINLPVTGCDSFCSSLTFNKYACNHMLRSLGIHVARSRVVRADQTVDPDAIADEIGFPCFVKPNNGGSSCGTHRVNRLADLPAALRSAWNEDAEALIEAFLDGTELTCGLLKSKGRFIVFPLTEIVSKNEFFDYEAKYTPGVADEITPARIPDAIRDQCQELSCRIYDLLNCRGLVRMDYILTAQGLHFLEVNTVPGMTTKSIVPQQVEAMGMQMSDVYDLILDDTLKD